MNSRLRLLAGVDRDAAEQHSKVAPAGAMRHFGRAVTEVPSALGE